MGSKGLNAHDKGEPVMTCSDKDYSLSFGLRDVRLLSIGTSKKQAEIFLETLLILI